ncbi:MAG: HD domain-containing protein [Sphingomonadales bacterium]|jgi:predicted HD phosphohydrolase|nr:HD domain-containing protein [Sphingomonadales bacterium]MBK6493429.1 HD domain-containing protein [Sphingomonadales bacterium]MBK6719696.1 HD domain-containing protein [Sphingomonadales bacterium]MBK7283118.1 HD domain-containing protein [Sphingomonadales bacterium]MBK8271862.1 HD domain-containing protein [Sphingomonadales bacterium]
MADSASATFHDMSQSTQQDWEAIMSHLTPFSRNGGRRVLDHLKLLNGDFGGFAIDRLQHCLQTATRAHQDGRSEDYVVMALLHDIGDTLGAYNHPDIAAAIIKPFVSEELRWITEHHGIFQGYNFFHHLGLDRNMRDKFRGHEYYEATADFIEKYDCPAFDPNYDTAPLEFFEPMVMKLFEFPQNSIYKKEKVAEAA